MNVRVRSERGAELIEFAIAMPVLLLVLLAIFDFALMFQRFEVITNAAREGARMAVLNATPASYSNADIKARVGDYIGAATGENPITTTWDAVRTPTTINFNGLNFPGQQVVVTYTYNYQFIGGIAQIFGGNFSSVVLTATSIMRNEGSPAPPP
jgi:Flp pilus assembly protein TadG